MSKGSPRCEFEKTETAEEKRRRLGPPPPTIPEFQNKELETSMDADDLFKDVK